MKLVLKQVSVTGLPPVSHTLPEGHRTPAFSIHKSRGLREEDVRVQPWVLMAFK